MTNRWSCWPIVLLMLGGATVAVLLPGLIGRPRVNESFWIDWVWLDQFARELQSGVLYPRWLPLSHNGLGSPVFYYYPPLAFYLGSLFVMAGLTTYSAVLATFVAASFLSGVGAYLWLRDQSRAPVVGAAIFVIAPYHAFDFYLRGALAEHVGIAALPFVMLGLRHVFEGKRGGVAIAAASYAALICSHLPLALLASVFLISPYVAWRAWKTKRGLLAAATGLAIGLAMASIYLVPAIALEPYRDASALWANRMLQPANWTFWNADFRTGVYLIVLLIAAALAIPAAMLIVRERSRWAMYAVGCMLLGIGLVPFLWGVPGLRAVQFPFRILPLAEFALATAMARAAWTPRQLAEACVPLIAVTIFVAVAKTGPDPVTIPQLAAAHPDVPENLPPGERPYSWPSGWALQVAEQHREARFANGITTDPVFYFPSWRVQCANGPAETFADPDTKLLSYRGTGCERTLGTTKPERQGSFLSLAGLLALLTAIAIGLQRRAAAATIKFDDPAGAPQEVSQ